MYLAEVFNSREIVTVEELKGKPFKSFIDMTVKGLDIDVTSMIQELEDSDITEYCDFRDLGFNSTQDIRGFRFLDKTNDKEKGKVVFKYIE